MRDLKMSTDYYLYSPSYNKSAMVGSTGLGGVKVWPTEYGGKDFIAWAIDNGVRDVVLIDEDRLDAMRPPGPNAEEGI